MIRYISKAYLMEAYHLSAATLHPLWGEATIDCYMPWKALPSVGLSALSVTEQVDNGLRMTTVKFSCTLEDWFHLPSRPVCLRLVCTDGTVWLMGQNCRPYPQVTQELTQPDRASERSVCTLTAQMTGGCGLMQIG